ncbi:MAG: hypothetical protein Q7R62_03315 [bacterium]|nr:hypothetical protein [bacterium]
MNTQSKHFIWWLLALTLLVVAVVIFITINSDNTPPEPKGTDILRII